MARKSLSGKLAALQDTGAGKTQLSLLGHKHRKSSGSSWAEVCLQSLEEENKLHVLCSSANPLVIAELLDSHNPRNANFVLHASFSL